METENNNVLYMHTRKSDGRIFYIGIGSKKRSKSRKGRSDFWYNIVNKHNRNITILAENLSWERACELENKMIAFYGRIMPNPKNKNYGCLCNLTDGGDGGKGRIVSDEEKQGMSERVSGDKNPMFGANGEKNPMFGRVGELHPMFGVKRPDHSTNMSGNKNPMANKTPYEIWVEKYGVEEANKREKSVNEKRSKTLKGNKNAKTVKVMCNITKKVYDTITDAAESIGMSKITLHSWLQIHPHRNKTSFVLI